MAYRWRTAFLWRSFSNPILWKALEDSGAVSPAEEPNWTLLETAFQTFRGNSLPLNGGNFRHTTLKRYRASNPGGVSM